MSSLPVYPLLQIIEVKQRRVEDAERVVREKQLALDKENEKLVERENERNKVKTHYQDKLKQLRATLDAECTSTEVQQMKVYIKIVDEKLKVEEKKVKDQKDLVKAAEKNLETAKENLRAKRQEVDKILSHKKEWEKEARRELAIAEAREQDELGSIIFMSKHKKKEF